MIYNLANDFARKRARARFDWLEKRGALVELTEKMQRTPAQNRYLHLLIGVLAMETGNTLEYSKEWYFKRLANPGLFIRKVSDPFAGEVEVLRSSADLSKEEMSTAIDRFKMWAAERGIYLPNPGDAELLKEIENEMAMCRAYL